MRPYEEQYISNLREILSLGSLTAGADDGGDPDSRRRALARNRQRLAALKRENTALLEENLFPVLDALHSASPEDIEDLTEFGDRLMDWTTNLDPGVYVSIHHALLSRARVQKDRSAVIRELYKLGMGLYFLDRLVEGVENEYIRPFRFRNEMVFTEAGSYLKFFPEMTDPETQGYIIRSLANISICTLDIRKKVEISGRVIEILQDDYYRALAPELPWDVFLRRTHQQMSANRAILSKGGLSARELASVLESCYEVFKPEENNNDPNIRWLWPYYEMEYSCGFVDLPTTLDRLERLIRRTPEEQQNESGLYGNVQLPVYYGLLLRDNPDVPGRSQRLAFLAGAYAKMLRVLLACPAEKTDDFFAYLIRLLVASYFETDGTPLFRDVLRELMRHFAGELYIRSDQAGRIMRILCEAILQEEADHFDDIPFIAAIPDPSEKQSVILQYTEECGLFHDLGLLQMNAARLIRSRELFENEDQMIRLHTVAGSAALKRCPSTAIYADIALGHHRWYNGEGGYPEEYVRGSSPCRLMTDVAAAAACLTDEYEYGSDPEEVLDRAVENGPRRFSPMVSALLADPKIRNRIGAVLRE